MDRDIDVRAWRVHSSDPFSDSTKTKGKKKVEENGRI